MGNSIEQKLGKKLRSGSRKFIVGKVCVVPVWRKGREGEGEKGEESGGKGEKGRRKKEMFTSKLEEKVFIKNYCFCF